MASAFGLPVGGRITSRLSETISETRPDRRRAVIVAARNEADRIGSTVSALARALPDALVVLADDGSSDGTARVALEAGAVLPEGGDAGRRRGGKGGAMTHATRFALAELGGDPSAFLLCDGDLGESASELVALVAAVESGRCDLAIASFARSEGGGFGIALGFARRAIERLVGLELSAPISGQRALRGEALERLLPFAPRFGMEIGLTTDAVRAGLRIEEIELDLRHRPTRRTPAGFAHRARQLVDFVRVYLSRRGPRPPH